MLVHTKEEEKARGVICFMRGYAQNKLGELPGMSTLFLGFLVITVMRYSGEDKSRFVAHSVVYNFPIKF